MPRELTLLLSLQLLCVGVIALLLGLFASSQQPMAFAVGPALGAVVFRQMRPGVEPGRVHVLATGLLFGVIGGVYVAYGPGLPTPPSYEPDPALQLVALGIATPVVGAMAAASGAAGLGLILGERGS